LFLRKGREQEIDAFIVYPQSAQVPHRAFRASSIGKYSNYGDHEVAPDCPGT